MELDLLVRDGVRRGDGGGAGVVVVELPRRDRAVAARAALDVDDARGPEVGPRELLLARPDELDGLAGRLRGRAASTAASPVCFPPYAEPVSGTWTRTFPPGMWNASASSSRTANGRCVPVHTVSFRRRFHSATAARGSRGACAMYSTVYVCESFTSAEAIASSTEPAALVVPRSPLTAFFRRECSKRVAREICSGTFHSAFRAARARSAVQASGAATPTKSPSRTTRAPGIFSAAEPSSATRVARNPDGRRTFP